MRVDLIEEPDSDLKVVNAARVSFDKSSKLVHLQPQHEPCNEGDTYCKEHHWVMQGSDIKLIGYLAAHKHWTPFGHCTDIFELHLTEAEELYFYRTATLSGFEWYHTENTLVIRGSLYAWACNLIFLPLDVSCSIYEFLNKKYPISVKNLVKSHERNYSYKVLHVDNDAKLQAYTLCIHVPIFVKRQLETHRRNLVMTGIDDVCQNEVSRRYVDSEPEIYSPNKWRLQSRNKKQGSDDTKELTWTEEMLTKSNYYHHNHLALQWYKAANNRGIAHEQSRLFLPLSTYTTFWWTGSVSAWKRIIELRCQPDVQEETRLAAGMISGLIPIGK